MYICLIKVSTCWLIEEETFPIVDVIIIEVLFHAMKKCCS